MSWQILRHLYRYYSLFIHYLFTIDSSGSQAGIIHYSFTIDSLSSQAGIIHYLFTHYRFVWFLGLCCSLFIRLSSICSGITAARANNSRPITTVNRSGFDTILNYIIYFFYLILIHEQHCTLLQRSHLASWLRPTTCTRSSPTTWHCWTAPLSDPPCPPSHGMCHSNLNNE